MLHDVLMNLFPLELLGIENDLQSAAAVSFDQNLNVHPVSDL